MLTYLSFPFLLVLALLGVPFGAQADSNSEEESEEEDKDETEDEEKDEEEEDSKDSESKDDEDEEDEEDWEKDFDADRAKRTIRKQRKSEKALSSTNKDLAARIKKYEDAEKESEDAKKSEIEKATERAEKAEATVTKNEGALKILRIEHAVAVEASIMGFIDPEDAYDLGDVASIAYDDEEESVNRKSVQKMLKALAEDKPYLVDEEADEARGTPRRHKEVRNRIRKHAKERKSKTAAGDVKEAKNPMPTGF